LKSFKHKEEDWGVEEIEEEIETKKA